MLVFQSLAYFDLAALLQLLQPHLVILVCAVFPAQRLQLFQDWEHAVWQGRALTPSWNDRRDGEEQCNIAAGQGHLGGCRRGLRTRFAADVIPSVSCFGRDSLNHSRLLHIYIYIYISLSLSGRLGDKPAFLLSLSQQLAFQRHSFESVRVVEGMRCALPDRNFMYLATASLLCQCQSLAGSPHTHGRMESTCMR